MSILSFSARLANKLPFLLSYPLNCFPIGNLRRANIKIDCEFSTHAIH
ncbi:hypothetical protein BMETH_1953_0 [methanotrophic bacterial endosymbiont of Bathymodiolus sp.]|nr:hypothetical protein BMETH_1953_0 [methanotrophic bacterial endosymbiont of Bathymodiolus sp.]